MRRGLPLMLADLAVNPANLQPAHRRNPQKCSPFVGGGGRITAKNSQP
jgi:hypothetical protein